MDMSYFEQHKHQKITYITYDLHITRREFCLFVACLIKTIDRVSSSYYVLLLFVLFKIKKMSLGFKIRQCSNVTVSTALPLATLT